MGGGGGGFKPLEGGGIPHPPHFGQPWLLWFVKTIIIAAQILFSVTIVMFSEHKKSSSYNIPIL